VPGKHVDGALLASDREGDFDRALPPEVREDPDQRVANRRVGRVEQPVKLLATPANPHIQLAAKSDDHAAYITEGCASDHATLHARHGCL